jgi:DNA-binding MarR family transcriptional regulator
MKPGRKDVQGMVAALMAVTQGLERARRRIPGAAKLAMLGTIAAKETARPSEMARELGVNQSSVTRQVQVLADEGLVDVTADAQDGRSCLITLSNAGRAEMRRLTEFGLARFELFVEEWDAKEVRDFMRLLIKFEQSKASVGKRESAQRRAGQRSWRE